MPLTIFIPKTTETTITGAGEPLGPGVGVRGRGWAGSMLKAGMRSGLNAGARLGFEGRAGANAGVGVDARGCDTAWTRRDAPGPGVGGKGQAAYGSGVGVGLGVGRGSGRRSGSGSGRESKSAAGSPSRAGGRAAGGAATLPHPTLSGARAPPSAPTNYPPLNGYARLFILAQSVCAALLPLSQHFCTNYIVRPTHIHSYHPCTHTLYLLPQT
jgi:hypothetical protein